jgi:hypothetical protein
MAWRIIRYATFNQMYLCFHNHVTKWSLQPDWLSNSKNTFFTIRSIYQQIIDYCFSLSNSCERKKTCEIPLDNDEFVDRCACHPSKYFMIKYKCKPWGKPVIPTYREFAQQIFYQIKYLIIVLYSIGKFQDKGQKPMRKS